MFLESGMKSQLAKCLLSKLMTWIYPRAPHDGKSEEIHQSVLWFPYVHMRMCTHSHTHTNKMQKLYLLHDALDTCQSLITNVFRHCLSQTWLHTTDTDNQDWDTPGAREIAQQFKMPDCSSRGPMFGPQHPHGSSPSVTPVPGNSVFSSDLHRKCMMWYT